MDDKLTIRAVYIRQIKAGDDGWQLCIIRLPGAMVPGWRWDGDAEVMAAGVLPADTTEGLPLQLTGSWQAANGSTTYTIDAATTDLPQSHKEAIAFCRTVRKIGKKRAEQICDWCHDDLSSITEDNIPELMTAVKGLKDAQATALVTRVHQADTIGDISRKYGTVLGVDVITRLASIYGADLADRLANNPYNIAGLGFTAADAVALTVNHAPADAPARLEAGALYALKAECIRRGAMMLPLSDYMDSLQQLLGDDIDSGKIKDALNTLRDNKAIIRCGSCIYSRYNYDAETALAQWVHDNSKTYGDDIAGSWAAAYDIWAMDHPDISLSAEQYDAVVRAGNNQTSIITGGPGTGKTTCLSAIIGVYQTMYPDEPITLLAPTGMAAKRMTQACGRLAQTIHHALLITPAKDDDTRYDDSIAGSIKGGLVVIDETSMVDIGLMHVLTKHIAAGTRSRIVVIGDMDQLPPVGGPSALAGLIASGAVCCTALCKNYRQGAGSAIVELARAVNTGSTDDINMTGAGTMMIDAKTADEVIQKTAAAYSQAVSTYGIRNVIVVCPTRQYGDVSTDILNPILRDTVNPAQPGAESIRAGRTTYHIGDRVINTKNAADAINGDMGIVSSIDPDGGLIVVDFDDGTRVGYDIQRAADSLTLAYAVTVHKSQGGEYACVILPLIDSLDFLQSRKIAYTAITRAKINMCVVGTLPLLRKAAVTVPASATAPKDNLAARIRLLEKKD